MIAVIFWDRKGILLTKFMASGTTLSTEVSCETQNKLRGSIQNNRRGILTKGVVLLHDNAPPKPRLAKILYNSEIFHHPPYSPDVAPSNYHLFTEMKFWLATQRFHTKEKLMDGGNIWLHILKTPFFDEGLQKLVSR